MPQSPDAPTLVQPPAMGLKRKITTGVRDRLPFLRGRGNEWQMKKDDVDIEGNKKLNAYSSACGALLGVAIAAGVGWRYPEIAKLAGPMLVEGPILFQLAMAGWALGIRTGADSEHIYRAANSDFGFRSDQIVYKGKKERSFGNVSIAPKETIGYVKLATFSRENSDMTKEQAQVILQTCQFSLNYIRQYTANFPTKASFIDIDTIVTINEARNVLGFPPVSELSDAPNIPRIEIFTNKQMTITQPWKRGALLDQETFENLSVYPVADEAALLRAGVQTLSERLGSGERGSLIQAYEAYQNGSFQQKEDARLQLRAVLAHVFSGQSEYHFGGAEAISLKHGLETDGESAPVTVPSATPLAEQHPVVLQHRGETYAQQQKTRHNQPPMALSRSEHEKETRAKEYYKVYESKGENSPRLLRHNLQTGVTERTVVALDDGVEEILDEAEQQATASAGIRNYTAIRLSHALMRLMDESTQSLDEQPAIVPPSQIILDRILETGLSIDPLNLKQNPFTKKESFPKGVKRKIAPLLATIAFMASLPALEVVQGELLGSLTGGTDSSGFHQIQLSDPSTRDIVGDTVQFPEGVPQSIPDWKIEVKGKIPVEQEPNYLSGYYVLDTSHEFVNGQWIINDQNPMVIPNGSLPTTMSDSTPHIELTRRYGLDLTGNSTFKLPIKTGFGIGALSITDPNGNELTPDQYTAYRIDDGTVKIVVHAGFSTLAFVNIRESLVPSEDSVHATVRTTSDFHDISQLSPEAQAEYLKARNNVYGKKGDMVSAIIFQINKDYLYNIAPTGPAITDFNTAVTAVEKLDAWGRLKVSTCSVANTPTVLLLSLDPHTIVNYAIGYAAGEDRVTKDGIHLNGYNGGYLNRAAVHGFALLGKDIVDSTPTTIDPKSPETSQYVLNTLNTPTNASDGLPISKDAPYDPLQDKWQPAQDTIANNAQAIIITAESMETVAAGIALTSAIALGVRGASSEMRRRKRLQTLPVPADAVVQQANRDIPSNEWLLDRTKDDFSKAHAFFNWLTYHDKKQPSERMPAPLEENEQNLMRIDTAVTLSDLQAYLNNPQMYEQEAVQTGMPIEAQDTMLFRKLAAFFEKRILEEVLSPTLDPLSLISVDLRRKFPFEDMQLYLQTAYSFLTWWSHPLRKGEPTLATLRLQAQNPAAVASLRENINYTVLQRYIDEPMPFEKTATEKGLSLTDSEKKFLRLFAAELLTSYREENA